MSKPHKNHWEMAHLTQKLMNWNKHKRKKVNQWRCKYYHATAETTILSVTVTWQTFQSSISFVAVIFLIMPKACHSSYAMDFKIKVKLKQNSRFMDFGSPWCDAGEETRQLFFLVNLRCLQNVQKWAVSLQSIPN